MPGILLDASVRIPVLAPLRTVNERLDPDAAGLAAAWAGETDSRNWFDVAREYTEKWHHQQQLRDATTARRATTPRSWRSCWRRSRAVSRSRSVRATRRTGHAAP
jgi:hypothetical protein